MPKKPNSEDKYAKDCFLTVLVNGCDDMEALEEKKLSNIEAGTYLHGYLVVKTTKLPEDTTGLAKFRIQGSHKYQQRHTTYKVDEEGNEHPVHHWSTDKDKWMKKKKKIALTLSSELSRTEEPDEHGHYTLTYPFSFQIDKDWCDSFHSSKGSCEYNLKTKFKLPDAGIKFKSKRKVDIMARRPTIEELEAKVPTDTEKHSSLIGGSLKAKIVLNAACFIEGTQVLFDAEIENTMERPVMTGDLKLIQVETYTVLYTDEKEDDEERWKTASCSRVLKESKLRGLEIPAETTKNLCFALDLPEKVEPPTTGFSHKHHNGNIKHILVLHLDVPWGVDVTTKFPVRIIPNPKRYVISRPPESLEEFVPAESSNPNYLPVPAVPIVAEEFQPPPHTQLTIELVSGKNLPKMDFGLGRLGGKADPYVTLYLGGQHVRTSHVVKNSRNPEFNESFKFFLKDYDPEDSLEISCNCYDYDGMTKDDKIGSGSLEICGKDTDKLYELLLHFDHKKKGVIERGKLLFRVVECAGAQVA